MTGSETRNRRAKALKKSIARIVKSGIPEDAPVVVTLKAALEEERSGARAERKRIIRMRVSATEAGRHLARVNVPLFRQTLPEQWQPKPDTDGTEQVPAQSICWLFCWAHNGRGAAQEGREEARRAFDAIFDRPYDWLAARFSKGNAEYLRYSKGRRRRAICGLGEASRRWPNRDPGRGIAESPSVWCAGCARRSFECLLRLAGENPARANHKRRIRDGGDRSLRGKQGDHPHCHRSGQPYPCEVLQRGSGSPDRRMPERWSQENRSRRV